jgi:ribosomal protein S14
LNLNKSVLKSSRYRNFNLCRDCFRAEVRRGTK